MRARRLLQPDPSALMRAPRVAVARLRAQRVAVARLRELRIRKPLNAETGTLPPTTRRHRTYPPTRPHGRTAATKIGRASCRERVEITVVAVSVKKKKTAEEQRIDEH